MQIETLTKTRCPSCAGQQNRPFLSDSDRQGVVVDRRFDLVACRQCGLVHLDPIPSREEIPGFYPKSYWWAMDLRRWRDRAMLTLRSLLWRDIVSIIKTVKPRGGDLLDVGCGSGVFLYCAKRAGFHCLGVEQEQETAGLVRRQFGVAVVAGGIEALATDARFDVITMFHVLEHVADPAQVLHDLRGRLAAGGHLLLEVPNIGSWGLRLFGKRWIGLDLPRHITHFDEWTLTTLLERTGYRVVSLRRFTWRNSPSMLAASVWPQALVKGKSDLPTRPIAAYVRLAGQGVLYLVFVAFSLLERACGNGEVLLALARPAQERP